MANIRQPIVTVCGHVDHGKTSILDCFRGTCIQEGEAGGITQKISFTKYPIDQLKKSCPLIESSGIKLNIPGFLFIDTPGHAAFTNLRKRGGSLADLAVLVIDINEGIKPQTAEVIKILKHNKTPFLIALNKLDNISGWRPPQHAIGGHGRKEKEGLKENIESQPINVKQIFDERYMTLIGSLNAYGFNADLYYNIQDFTKKIALIPCSARTKEGIQELIMMLCGLSQKYLTEKLELNKDAKGIILEIKKEKSTPYVEAILYDGELSRTDQIAIANFNREPTITKIRILEEMEPLCAKFKPKEKVQASTGLRMQLIGPKGVSSGVKSDILPGMPFEVYKNNLEEIKEKFKKEISENIKTDKQGIITKADSLGSLEALLTLLKEKKIPVVKAGIGNINKTDIISAKANIKINELDALIIGFNVSIEEDAKEIQGNTKIITNDVVYRLIDDLVKFRETKSKEIEKQRLMELATICKVEILPQYIFRNSNPAVFGVKILGGKIRAGLNLNNDQGEKVGRLKNIQSENEPVNEATENMEVAISIPGVNFERQLKETRFLYSEISESQFRKFKKNKDLLSESEKKILQEIAVIRRQKKEDWGV
ncbi:MAG: translation initiation factor IF-2 [archaeon]